MPWAIRLPLAAMLRSRIMRPSSTSKTSISDSSEIAPTLAVTLALEPIPVGGPETRQLVSMWSVKASWLAITSR